MKLMDWVSILSDITVTITAILFPFLFRYYEQRSKSLQVVQELMQSWDNISNQVEYLNIFLYNSNTESVRDMMQRCILSCDLNTGRPTDPDINKAKRKVNTFLRTVESYVSEKQYSYKVLKSKDLHPMYDNILLALRIVEPYNWVWHQINGNNSIVHHQEYPHMIWRPDSHITLSKILHDLNETYYEKKNAKYTLFLTCVLCTDNWKAYTRVNLPPIPELRVHALLSLFS